MIKMCMDLFGIFGSVGYWGLIMMKFEVRVGVGIGTEWCWFVWIGFLSIVTVVRERAFS
jgi:hypothetical protein